MQAVWEGVFPMNERYMDMDSEDLSTEEEGTSSSRHILFFPQIVPL